MMDSKICKGDVFLADFEPQTHKSEAGKIRPVVILQRTVFNDIVDTLLVAPFTTACIKDGEPLQISFKKSNMLEKDSDLLLSQIRVISKDRLIKKIGVLTQQELLKIDRYLLEIFDIKKG